MLRASRVTKAKQATSNSTHSVHLDVTDASPARFALGIETLLDGGTITLHGVSIAVRDSQVHVTVCSQWAPENLTETFAREELARAESIYSTLLSQHPFVASRFRRLPVIYELLHDYGMGCVLLCTLTGSRLTWSHPFQPKAP